MPSCATVAQLGEGQWTRNRTGAAWQPDNCEAHIGDPCSALSAPAGTSKFVVMLGDAAALGAVGEHGVVQSRAQARQVPQGAVAAGHPRLEPRGGIWKRKRFSSLTRD